jgi:hypothetical protein
MRSNDNNPATRPTAISRDGSALAIGRHPVEFHAVIDEAEAELLGNAPLEILEFLVDELDHVAGLDVDQVIVVRVRGRLIARAAVAELVALEDSPNRRTVR